MKTVILAGGFGTRISEESRSRPKPMIEIGNMPILWHIMKIYSSHGFNDFVICCGYKQYIIKEFFAHYFLRGSDITFDISMDNKMTAHSNFSEPWRVTVVDTGLHTMTGGRIKRIQDYVGDEPFMLTYGDGLSDINIKELIEYHKSHKKIATLTTVNVSQRFGILNIKENNEVIDFREKSYVDGSQINGGFMVLNPEVFDYIQGDETVFEKEPLENLAHNRDLMAYRHNGFWKCMDTQRDLEALQEMWESGAAPWKTW